MKLSVKIALSVVLIIAITAILIALIFYFKKHADLSNANPDFVVTAASLQKEFEQDEVTASAKYINKILELSGEIQYIARTDSNSLNLSLKTDNEYSSVICTFSEGKGPSDPKTGDIITLRGICSGYLMDVLLNNCALISNK
jgi:tRNA_anti-like